MNYLVSIDIGVNKQKKSILKNHNMSLNNDFFPNIKTGTVRFSIQNLGFMIFWEIFVAIKVGFRCCESQKPFHHITNLISKKYCIWMKNEVRKFIIKLTWYSLSEPSLVFQNCGCRFSKVHQKTEGKRLLLSKSRFKIRFS